LRDDSGRFIRDVLRDADPAIFDQAALQRLIDGHDRGRNNAQRIFAVMMFELWRRTFSVKLP
jgi:asparagine synthase (glutamine-hydrolysing)